MDNLTKFFSFELPTKIIYGANCLDNLCIELKENEGKKPIIITDKGVEKAGILKKITDLLDKDDFPYVVYDGVEANPKDVNVEEGAKIARENDCDCIIAVSYTHLINLFFLQLLFYSHLVKFSIYCFFLLYQSS